MSVTRWLTATRSTILQTSNVHIDYRRIYRMPRRAEFPTIPPDALDALAHPHPAKPQTKSARKASALCVVFALAGPAYVRH